MKNKFNGFLDSCWGKYLFWIVVFIPFVFAILLIPERFAVSDLILLLPLTLVCSIKNKYKMVAAIAFGAGLVIGISVLFVFLFCDGITPKILAAILSIYAVLYLLHKHDLWDNKHHFKDWHNISLHIRPEYYDKNIKPYLNTYERSESDALFEILCEAMEKEKKKREEWNNQP